MRFPRQPLSSEYGSYIGQARPDSGLGLQVNSFKLFKLLSLFSLDPSHVRSVHRRAAEEAVHIKAIGKDDLLTR